MKREDMAVSECCGDKMRCTDGQWFCLKCGNATRNTYPATEPLLDVAKRINQLLGGWREVIVELEDWCAEPVRLKNMIAAADQIDELAPKLRAAIEERTER